MQGRRDARRIVGRQGLWLAGCAFALVALASVCQAQPGWNTYRETTRLFGLRYPADWIVREKPTSEGFEVAFTPNHDQSIPVEDLPVVAKVEVFWTPYGNVDAYLKPEDVFSRQRPVYEAVNRKYDLKFVSQESVQVKTTSGTISAVEGHFTARTGTMEVAEEYRRIPRPRWVVALITDAPKGDAALKATMDELQASFELSDSLTHTPLTPAAAVPSQPDLVKKLRECTVLILVKAPDGETVASGSGFIVHPAGYIMTNAHVVTAALDDEKVIEVSDTVFEVHWDRSLGREPVAAKYVTHVSDERRGVDFGLLHIDSTDLPHLTGEPASKVDNLAEMVTASFPTANPRDEKHDVTFSKGKVLRINHDARDRVESIYTDAQIDRGSSGSACVDLATGKVTGVNTYVSQGDLQLYNGVVPIEMAYEALAPLYYPPEGGWKLTAQDHYKLGGLFWAFGSLPSAEEQLAAACLPDNPSPHAWTLRGMVAEASADAEHAGRHFETALQYDPTDTLALDRQAQALMGKGQSQYAKAAALVERRVKAAPDDPDSYLLRGQLGASNNQYDTAIGDYQKAIELAHDLYPSPYTELARTYQKRKAAGDLDRAREAVEKALSVDAADDDALILASELDADKPGANLARFGRLAAKYPEQPAVQWLLGRALAANDQDLPGALKCYQKALKLFSARELDVPTEFFGEAGAFGLRQNAQLARDVYYTMYQTVPDDPKLNAASLLGLSQALLRVDDRGDLALALERMASDECKNYVARYLRTTPEAKPTDKKAKLGEASAVFAVTEWEVLFAAQVLAQVPWTFKADAAGTLTQALGDADLKPEQFLSAVKAMRELAAKRKTQAQPIPAGLHVGDKVKVIPTAQSLCEKDNGVGWFPEMAALVGKVCMIRAISDDGTVALDSPTKGEWWWLPVEAVKKG